MLITFEDNGKFYEKTQYSNYVKVYESNFNAGINGKPYVNKDLVGKSFKISGTKLETTNYFVIEYD